MAHFYFLHKLPIACLHMLWNHTCRIMKSWMCTICNKCFHPTYGWVVLHTMMWVINTEVAEAAFSVLLLPSLVTFYLAASSVADVSSFSISSSSAPLFTPFTWNKSLYKVVQSLSEVSFRNCENLCNKWTLNTWGKVSVPFTSVAFGGFTMGIT